jgi:hypothetical protein
VPLGLARAAAVRLLARLEREPAALRLAVGGEVRRMAPWVSRLELVASGHATEPLLDALARAPRVAAVLERSSTRVLVRLADGLDVVLDVLPDEDAVERRLAAEGQPPERPCASDLVRMADCLGIAGLHTKDAGGRYGADEMAARAEREGYAWALLPPCSAAPASETLHVLGAREVEVGVEPHRLPGGDEWLLAAPAPSLCADGRAATRALVAALAGGAVDAAVPRGVGVHGAGTPYDAAALAAALKDAGAALGVAPPPRHAEPEPGLLEAALAAGVPLLLLADARDLVGVDDLALAVGLARRAGARAGDVLNARTAAEVEAWRAARRRPR